MTTPDTATPDLGSFGAWTFHPNASNRGLGPRVTPGQAREIERLGYGTLWVAGSPPAELSFAEPFLESTAALKVATGNCQHLVGGRQSRRRVVFTASIPPIRADSCSASGPAILSTPRNTASPTTRWSTTSTS